MSTRSARPSRRLIVWLLACLVPLQAMAAGCIAAAGPAHSHLPAAAMRLVLDDFRRAPARRVAAESNVVALSDHFHGGASAERHHHAPGDPSVVADGTGRLQSGDAEDIGTSPSLGVVVGLISAPPDWLAAASPAPPASGARWTPQTHDPDFPERPPRAG